MDPPDVSPPETQAEEDLRCGRLLRAITTGFAVSGCADAVETRGRIESPYSGMGSSMAPTGSGTLGSGRNLVSASSSDDKVSARLFVDFGSFPRFVSLWDGATTISWVSGGVGHD